MENSTHQAELVKVELSKHPNADNLSIIKIYGYVYVGKTEVWQGVEYAVWFCPDTLVDTSRPEFAELKADGKFNPDSTKGGSFARIKAKKLRGIVSYGYMVPAKPDDLTNPDLFASYGCSHYDPPMVNSGGNAQAMGGEVAKGPGVYAPKYDVDSFQRYAQEVFVPGELVVVTEKIHGANGRWVYHDGEFYAGSRTEWKKEFPTPVPIEDIEADMRKKSKLTGEQLEVAVANMKDKVSKRQPAQSMWWKALRQYPELMAFLVANPDTVVYGEVYGEVQNMKYGAKQGEVRIGLFDMLKDGVWLDNDAAQALGTNLPWVPSLGVQPFDFDTLVELAEGPSLVPGANHFREGICIRPVKERSHPSIGRVLLKVVSPSYLEQK